MKDHVLKPLFTWRSAVASEHGPASPLTRLVLLTLSLHMNEKGTSCFPSQELLAEQSGLSLRAVKLHMALAIKDGWLVKRERNLRNSKGWRHNEYFPRIPSAVRVILHAQEMQEAEGGAPDAPATAESPAKAGKHGGARNAPPPAPCGQLSDGAQNVRDGGAPPAPSDEKVRDGGAPDGTIVVHEVHPSTSMSTRPPQQSYVGTSTGLSTADAEKGAAAAENLVYPEKLSSPERSDAARLLNGVNDPQLLLDELAGVMATKGVKNPMGLLLTFIEQRRAGAFTPSHAYAIEAEREGRQVQREIASARAEGRHG